MQGDASFSLSQGLTAAHPVSNNPANTVVQE
jgi:hypothetical protein